MWEQQYNRILRYRNKLEKYQNARYVHPLADDYIDDVYTCIQHLHHLKDWLISSGVISAKEANDLIDENSELQIVQDICIGTKHLTPKIKDKNLSVGYMSISAPYIEKGVSHESQVKLLLFDMQSPDNYLSYEVISIVDDSMSIWKKFLLNKKILHSEW